jgi:hypothetical protein
MATERLETSLDNLDRALSQLERALAQPAPNDLEVDGTIQRFEFSVELFWKTLRRALLEEGRVAESPRQAIAGAWRMGWLEVFGRIAGYARAMRTAHGVLVARFRPASTAGEKRVPYRPASPVRGRGRSRVRSPLT